MCLLIPIKDYTHLPYNDVTGMPLSVYDDTPPAADILEYYTILSAAQGSWVQVQLDWCGLP